MITQGETAWKQVVHPVLVQSAVHHCVVSIIRTSSVNALSAGTPIQADVRDAYLTAVFLVHHEMTDLFSVQSI